MPITSFNLIDPYRFGSAPHSYWRVYVTDNNGDVTWITANEIEMRATPGGADQCSGGTVIKSNEAFGNEATKAFDNNNATAWGYNVNNNQWIGYQFTSPVMVQQILLRVGQAGDAAPTLRAPKNCKVEYSDDGVAWAESFSFVHMPNVDYDFLYPASSPASGYHRCWRIYCSDNNGDGTWIGLQEVELRATASAADQTAPPGNIDGTSNGRAIASNRGSTLDEFNAFANSTLRWMTNVSVTNQWVGYVFPAAVKVEEVQLTGLPTPARSPKNMLVQYSDDLVTWTTQKTLAAQTGWSASEVRVLAAI